MDNSENIVRQYHEALNSHDYDKIRQLLHPQYSHTDNDGNRREGPQGGIEFLTMIFNAFPDWRMNVKNIKSTGDITVTEFTAEGTQKGVFMDVNPTNRRVAVPVCGVIEIKDNKLYSERDYWDNAAVMQQLGIKMTAQA